MTLLGRKEITSAFLREMGVRPVLSSRFYDLLLFPQIISLEGSKG